MDTPTAMLMATTYGVALLGRRAGLAGGVLCAVGALVPDLDVAVPGGTTEFITWHRGPTHSLLFLAAFTPVLAGLARLCGSKRDFRWLCVSAALGLAFGIATDVVTWWGTVVLWPFSRVRLGVGLIFIIDLWHSAIVLSPFIAWGVQRLRGLPFPRRAFQVAAGLSVAWMLLCTGAHLGARVTGERLATERGAELEDVLPQPFSPFRWSCVLGTPEGHEVVFIDHLRPGEVLEQRTFRDDADAAASAITDATDDARLLRWFFRHPYVTTNPVGAGATEVVYEDLSYQVLLPAWYGPPRLTPFRYRFRVESGAVTDQGWLGRD